MLVISY